LNGKVNLHSHVCKGGGHLHQDLWWGKAVNSADNYKDLAVEFQQVEKKIKEDHSIVRILNRDENNRFEKTTSTSELVTVRRKEAVRNLSRPPEVIKKLLTVELCDSFLHILQS
jgi:hypothetical protein